MKDNAQRRLRDRTSARIRALLEQGKVLKTERQFHVSFPKLESHQGHEVGQVLYIVTSFKYLGYRGYYAAGLLTLATTTDLLLC